MHSTCAVSYDYLCIPADSGALVFPCFVVFDAFAFLQCFLPSM